MMSRLRSDENTLSPQTSGRGGTSDIALLSIGADLLPQKTVAGGVGRGRRFAAIAIVLVSVVAVAGAYLFSLHARSSAQSALGTAQDQQNSLQTQQKSFEQLVRTQAQAEQLDTALATIMKTDTSWSTVLAGIAKADDGIDFNSITAGLADPTAPAATGAAAPTTAGAIGTLTMTGTAADKPRIATFVDALGSTPGLADPFLSTVNAAADSSTATGYTFSVTVSLTDDLQSSAASRWTVPTGGGK